MFVFGCKFFLGSVAILGCIWLLLADWMSGNRKQGEIKVNRFLMNPRNDNAEIAGHESRSGTRLVPNSKYSVGSENI